jgi:uncharacterized membrane protein YidH (DUF202 family)
MHSLPHDRQSNTWDPKAFMANERTFYHWIRFALSLAIFSIGLSDKNSPGLNTKLIAVLVATDLMIIYAVCIYRSTKQCHVAKATHSPPPHTHIHTHTTPPFS